MPDFKKLIARLKRHYGEPKLPPAHGPFELVMWENACYLLPDERRAEVFEGLRTQVGLKALAILKANGETLLALAKRGGMRPETACSAGARLRASPSANSAAISIGFSMSRTRRPSAH
jgi:endonuclease-3